MMSEVFKTIFAEDLKHYVESSKSCKFTQACCEIEPKGSIEINLVDIFDTISIFGRRHSGNGKLIVSYDDLSFDKSFLSKNQSQIDLKGLSKFKIERGPHSLGLIELLSINLYKPEESDQVQDWKAILSRCKQYKCVRIAAGKLYASEGALIKADGIDAVSTKPPNMFKVSDDTVKFLGTCEITELNVTGVRKIPQELYPHVGGPPQSIVVETYQDIKYISSQTISMSNQTQQFPNNTLYEGSGNSLFKLNGIRDVSFNGKSILLGHTGSLAIPISGIQPNGDYIVIIETSKVDGNGKLSSYITPTSDEDHQVQFISEIHKAYNFTLRSGPVSYIEGAFKLIIERPQSATGSVAISKVTLIKDHTAIKAPPPNARIEYYNPAVPGLNLIKSPIILNTLAPSARQEIVLDNTKDKKFVIVIPSYNNERWVEQNISSALTQNYKNYRVIYVDDCSTDNTFNIARLCINKYNGNLKTTLVRNTRRVGAMENLYNAIHSCDNEEIILTLDGDDWLENNNVLNTLNNVYKSQDAWVTYGQYTNSTDHAIGISQPIPENITTANMFRSFTWCSSHLRTFYAWLFKKIKREDFIYEGRFMSMAWDLTIMLPLLEMAGLHSKYIGDILYVYNLANPISDHMVDRNLQKRSEMFVRSKAKYSLTQPTNSLPEKKTKVGLIIISTGKYHEFINPLINSADRYFLGDDYDVSYFVFSDKKHDIPTDRKVNQIHIDHVGFPYATLNRFKYFTENKDVFEGMDYLYYVDVDCLWVDNIGEEIIGNLVGTQHCGYINGGGTYENNPQSVHYVDPSKYTHYFAGGLQGGSKDAYLQLAAWCYEHIEQDLKNNIMLLWHDESSINRYFLDHPPTVILSPSYHFPQNIDSFRHLWGNQNFEPKLLLLEKYHEKARE
jgi:glycosyltransferase involved in cell wall biosynthesis